MGEHILSNDVGAILLDLSIGELYIICDSVEEGIVTLRGENHGGVSDLVVALSGVVNVDDDNQPAPENIPTMTDTPSIISTEWGHEGVCFRKEYKHPNSPAILVHPVDTARDNVNLQLFEHLFPKNFLQDVMIPTMNRKLSNAVLYGELLSWISLWVLMSSVDGSDHWMGQIIGHSGHQKK